MLRPWIAMTFAMILLACVSGCAATQTTDGIPVSVTRNWQQNYSYYALLEIVDEHIDPHVNKGVTKDMVRKYIGQGIDHRDGYPNAGPDFWVYPSHRRVPYESYLCVLFGSDGFVNEVFWVSE